MTTINLHKTNRRAVPLAAAIAVLGVLALSPPADAARTVFKGKIHCFDRGVDKPLVGAVVQLRTRGQDPFPIDGLAEEGYTNSNGEFSLTAMNPVERYFVRVGLRSEKGVRLKDLGGINDWAVDSNVYVNDTAERSISMNLRDPGYSHKCAVWQGVRDAYAKFINITGKELPSKGVLIQADNPFNAGTPFAWHQEIWWPSRYPVGDNPGENESARHEFGHVIRHSYDGDGAHFTGDIASYNYLQDHWPCKQTNAGFAFNEGWAEYWSGEVGLWLDCPGISSDDYTVEGRVAGMLGAMEITCYGGDRAPMVAILRQHPGVIHSLAQFRSYSTC